VNGSKCLLVGVLGTAFGAIRLGSTSAFNDLVGSFVILTTMRLAVTIILRCESLISIGSYLLAILPHLLTGRRNIPIGA
jgi:choline transport protein